MTDSDSVLISQGFRLLFHYFADEGVSYHKYSKEARLIDDASDALLKYYPDLLAGELHLVD